MTFEIQFIFMASLMFVYADFASAIPFSNTMEGIVYLKKEFVKKKGVLDYSTGSDFI